MKDINDAFERACNVQDLLINLYELLEKQVDDVAATRQEAYIWLLNNYSNVRSQVRAASTLMDDAVEILDEFTCGELSE